MILAALTIAALYALFYPQPERVVKYLYAKLYGNVILFAVNHWYGATSLAYGVAYALVTTVILATIIAIVLGAMGHKQRSYRGAAFVGLAAWALGLFCYANIEHPKYYDLIGITEGAVLFWAALCLGFLAPYMENRATACVLTWLWFGQAMFRIWFYATEQHPIFLWLNWRLPPLLGITGFILLGWLSRRKLYSDVARATSS